MASPDGPAVDRNRPRLVCARCGDRVGVYEPLWVELPDGTLRLSSYLNLDPNEIDNRGRYWHRDCREPDAEYVGHRTAER